MKGDIKSMRNLDYCNLNRYARKGQILFIGSSFAKNFPIFELMQDYEIDSCVYKRAIEDFALIDAYEDIMEQMTELDPVKLFLCFGDDDIANDNFNEDAFIDEYKRILAQISRKFPKCKLYVFSVVSDNAIVEQLNARLESEIKSLAEFVPVHEATHSDYNEEFRTFKAFLRRNDFVKFGIGFSV